MLLMLVEIHLDVHEKRLLLLYWYKENRHVLNFSKTPHCRIPRKYTKWFSTCYTRTGGKADKVKLIGTFFKFSSRTCQKEQYIF
jgi:hypothetical protein